MKQLCDDHHHLQRLLYCLQKEVSYFEDNKPGDADWKTVETRMAQPADPLFGESIRGDYQALYQRILDSEHKA